MTLVDTSVWVDHFKLHDPNLSQLLNDGEVVCHPFVIGELACGGIKNRAHILALLRALPCASLIDDSEFHEFLERQRLWGQGLGFVDVHLLGSARVDGITLWTADGPLKRAAAKLGLSA